MATRAEELAKLIGSPRLSSGVGYRSPILENSASGAMGYFWPIVTSIFVLFLLLLVVHFTITPIFSFAFGSSGIPLAQTNDGQLVWAKGPVAADLSANVIRILPDSFTVQMDVFVENETTLGKFERVLFYRSRRAVIPNNSDTLMNQYPESNLIVRLSPDTNDLSVSAITLRDPNNPLTATLESTPTILNVPIRQPFRITIVLLSRVLEVYLNGRLFGTKTFRYSLRSGAGYFFGPPDLYRQSVRIMNVQYWNRALNSAEVRSSGPALPDASLFGPAPIPGAKCQ